MFALSPTERLRLGDGWLPPEPLASSRLSESAEADATVVWAHGPVSSFEIDLTTPRDLTLEARGWPFRDPAEADQTMTLWVGHEVAGSWQMRPGTHEYRVEIPARLLRPGRNQLSLRPSVVRTTEEPAISAAFSSLQLTPTQQTQPSVKDGDLVIPWGSELLLYLRGQELGTLAVDALESARDARLTIRVETDEVLAGSRDEALHAGSVRALRTHVAGPQSGPGGLDLSDLAPPTAFDDPSRKLFRIRLTAHHPSRIDGTIRLRNPRLLLRPAQPSAPEPDLDLARSADDARSTPERPDLLLVVVDTLRADRLGVYGANPSLTPRLDAFADDAIVFSRTTAQSSWTRASMASAFTGLGPEHHRVESRRDVLAPELLTLAEALAAQGYRTAGWTTNGNSGRAFGFDQGFETFEQLEQLEPGLPARGDAVLHRLFEWLDAEAPPSPANPPGLDREPLFLYAHTMEPHAPYGRSRITTEPATAIPKLSAETLEALRTAGVPTEGPTHLGSVAWLQAMLRGLVPTDPQAVAELVATYDVSVAETDRLFGRLLDGLARRGRLDPMVVVFLSDHGEEFHEHDGFAHGLTLYEEQLRVPFLVRLPTADARRGIVSRARARHIDLVPTVLDALGLPGLPALDGRSLLADLEGRHDPPAFARLRLDGRTVTSWLEGDHKIVCTEDSACRLFDLASDPGEQVDRAAETPIRAAYLTLRLERYLTRRSGLGQGEPGLEASSPEIDPETERQLRALGYL